MSNTLLLYVELAIMSVVPMIPPCSWDSKYLVMMARDKTCSLRIQNCQVVEKSHDAELVLFLPNSALQLDHLSAA